MEERLHPVGLFGITRFLNEHPPILNRLEKLLRLLDPKAPLKTAANPGSRNAFFDSAASLLQLFYLPLLYGVLLLLAPWWSWLPIMIMGGQIVRLIAKIRSYGSAPGVLTDRLRAYSEHPDETIRAWAAQALAYAKTLNAYDQKGAARINARLAELRDK